MNKFYLMSPQNTLDILYRILSEVEQSNVSERGLCCLFGLFHEYSLRDCLKQAGIHWNEWPEFSGNESYPVPSVGYPVGADCAYHITRNLWDKSNPYCLGRYRLLDWLIQQLKDVIAKIPDEPPRVLPTWNQFL